MRTVKPTPDLRDQNLHFNKIPAVSVHSKVGGLVEISPLPKYSGAERPRIQGLTLSLSPLCGLGQALKVVLSFCLRKTWAEKRDPL